MCDCIQQLNEQLKPKNLKLSQSLMIKPGKVDLSPVIIAVELIDVRKGYTMPLFATYCPFCGEKYETASTVDADT